MSFAALSVCRQAFLAYVLCGFEFRPARLPRLLPAQRVSQSGIPCVSSVSHNVYAASSACLMAETISTGGQASRFTGNLVVFVALGANAPGLVRVFLDQHKRPPRGPGPTQSCVFSSWHGRSQIDNGKRPIMYRGGGRSETHIRMFLPTSTLGLKLHSREAR